MKIGKYNFLEAQKKFPKSIELFFKWFYETTGYLDFYISKEGDFKYNFKILNNPETAIYYFSANDLDEFFDYNGLPGSIIAVDFGASEKAPFKFGWQIRKKGMPLKQSDEYLLTRNEALIERLNVQFELLEESLK